MKKSKEKAKAKRERMKPEFQFNAKVERALEQIRKERRG